MGFQRYTGTAPLMPFAPWRGMVPPGHCRQCGQPSGSCCCGCRECRKEAKELVVSPGTRTSTGQTPGTTLQALQITKLPAQLSDAASNIGGATAFIGGGCCVTLAVEYAASVATAAFAVVVMVKDSEGTVLAWGREEAAGTSYRVHECIITTKPGATLLVEVSNCTARVRWCEVFSCC
jgi:hypothetical protein